MRRALLALTVLFSLAAGLAPAGTAAAAPAQPASAVYVVRSGDSLIGIATRLNVRLADLLAANRLTLHSLIWPGMRLTVPGAPSAPAVAPAATGASTAALTYTVRPGDGLIVIAQRFGVKVADLLAANGLRLDSVVHPGRVLTLPRGAVVPTAQPAPAAQPTKVERVVAFALAQRGLPYRFNAAGPDAYDCSGLVRAAFATVGVSLPHQSALQATFGQRVDWTTQPILPGDLIFTRSSSSPAAIGHVGIAVSATAWVQAPQPGDVVRSGPIPHPSRIVEVRRILPAGS